jgi:hypothetical protein
VPANNPQVATVRAAVAYTLDKLDTLQLPDNCTVIVGQHAASGGRVSLFPNDSDQFRRIVAQLADTQRSPYGAHTIGFVGGATVWVFPPDGIEVRT